MITKYVKLYLGDGFPVRIPVSQFDTMWQFVFEIIHNSQPWQIPTGATAVLNGKKPDGNVFAFSGTIENNTVTVDADVQMTAVAGQTVCELSILADGKTVGTANFILDVEEAPKSADDVVSDTVLDGYGMMVTNAVDDYIERHPEVFGGDKFTKSAKNALLALLGKVAYIDENGQTYIDALESELFPPASLVSIAAVFTQGSVVIYDTDSLNTLRQYLVVTASYDDGTTGEVTAYELSGTLTGGTSVITATYDEKTTTFNVTVTSTYLYTLENQAVTTTEESKLATGIDLISTDKDFSICFDASIGTKNGSYKLFYAWENASPWRGPTCGAGGSNAFSVKYLASYTIINNIASSVTSAKVVMVHAAGSGKAVFYSRINGASSTTITTITENFIALTPNTIGLTFGYHTPQNNWAGTINRAYVRSVALTAEQAESFLAGE